MKQNALAAAVLAGTLLTLTAFSPATAQSRPSPAPPAGGARPPIAAAAPPRSAPSGPGVSGPGFPIGGPPPVAAPPDPRTRGPGGFPHGQPYGSPYSYPYSYPYAYPYGFAFGVGGAPLVATDGIIYGNSVGAGDTRDRPAVRRPPATLVIGPGGPLTTERRVGRSKVIELERPAAAGAELVAQAVGDTLIRLRRVGSARGVREVSLFTADARRQPLAVQTLRAAPFSALLPATAGVRFVGVTEVNDDGASLTRVIPYPTGREPPRD